MQSTRGQALTTMSAPTVGFRGKTTIDESAGDAAPCQAGRSAGQEGDREAIRFLYVQYSHNIYGYVRSIIHDEHEAEDVTQHVFAKLITSIVKYDDRGVPFFAWLLRLARNMAIDQLRANRLTPTEHVLDPETTSGASISTAPRWSAPHWRRFPTSSARSSMLRHVVGLTPGEIADRHGANRGVDSRPASSRSPGAAEGTDPA